MQRVLVTGVEDMLGSNLAWALSGRCDVLGCSRNLAVESPCFPTTFWHPGDAATMQELLAHWQPQWIVHCPPGCESSWDAVDREIDPGAEATVASDLAAAAARLGCPLTVIVSDAVFDGPRMFHDESSTPLATSMVAQHCRAVERALATSAALVVRTHAYGWSGDQGPCGFAERCYESLCRGKLPACDGRRYATPILAADLADLLWHANQTRLEGLLHLAGAERTSMQRFVREMAVCLGVPYPQAAHATGEHDWHEETSLSSRRARRILARPTPLLRAGLERFLAQAEGHSRPRWCVRERRATAEAAA